MKNKKNIRSEFLISLRQNDGDDESEKSDGFSEDEDENHSDEHLGFNGV